MITVLVVKLVNGDESFAGYIRKDSRGVAVSQDGWQWYQVIPNLKAGVLCTLDQEFSTVSHRFSYINGHFTFQVSGEYCEVVHGADMLKGIFKRGTM